MLDSKQIIDAAKNQTNLEYFGNPLFLNGFECLVQFNQPRGRFK